MKTFKQFREECGCKDKARKSKKKGNVEVMPTIDDGKKGMTTQVNNESVKFAGNYQGPLYAPHPDIIKEKAPAGAKYESCLLYTSPSPRDRTRSRMPSSA